MSTIVKGSENFTDQQPFEVTQEDLVKPWGGMTEGQAFGCAFCLVNPDIEQHQFSVGDVARWVYVGSAPNIFVCQTHDHPDVVKTWESVWERTCKPILRRWGQDWGRR